MTRYVGEERDGKQIAFGFDHVIGYFFIQSRILPNKEKEVIQSLSSQLTRLKRHELIDLLHQHLSPEEQVKYKTAFKRIALDLPI